jgi:hypothetical protein
MKKKPITKKELEKQPLTPWIEDMSYTRYRDGRIVPEGMLGWSPPRVKREYIPGGGYVTKMRRK